ncbi:MAG: Holliday junction resolvase RuvX [Verrucomicrobia bacterium]|nr:Holliday junction resolvase RuvX [Verrucomicrobiota bacterium]
MGRILSFDYGKVRIGAASSDERKIIASPFLVFTRHKKIQNTYKEILDKTTKLTPIELIIVGLPLLLNGKEGEMALEAKAFGEGLSQYLSIPCIFWDERLSSSQVERMLKEGSLSRKERAGLSDTLSATLILQNYLDFQLNKKNQI